ncbi:type II secretion system minor pseudopilin GspI [Pseudomonas violetae]|jgi:general secretion pathway protein I|uniref:Type II secretion system protein I n=1 Tax=Pseudomonas violetae TaxID=2915813 RepID=A0ABT0F5N0_9PSED|nr:type II secretion system minor pseudopilin GspI [Pseudomonas violetae]MCK1792939.1 type II secretion system minor pseudopilin GspI [Pseudomonas violetae]
MVSRLVRSPQRGFTLLEIMVALGIFATLAAAVLSAGQYVVKQTSRIEERVFSTWVADNRLNELHLQPAVTLGQRQQTVSMGRRQWVLREHVSPANEPRLLRLDVEVSLDARGPTLHRASGWVSRHAD